jgi:hypothetical protein
LPSEEPLYFSRCFFSPDGRWLALRKAEGNESGTWEVREMLTGECVLRREGSSDVGLAISPDGTVLAYGEKNDIRLLDLTTGEERAVLRGHRGPIVSLCFSGDGETLLSGSVDTTVLVWSVAEHRRRTRQPASPTDRARQSLWETMGQLPAESAHRAMRTLAASPGESAAFLKEHLRPIAQPSSEQLTRLIADLDDRRFGTRSRAAAELAALEQAAVPAMRKTLSGAPSLEMRRRLEALIAEADEPWRSSSRLRSFRAVQVLEWMATDEARAILKAIAAGAPEARLTQEAASSLRRPDKRR